MTEQTNVVPKRRFKEFQSTQAWERRKFSELVSRVSTSNEDEGLPRVEFEDIVSGLGQLNKDIFQKESDKKGFEFKPGDTIFGKLRPYLKNWLMPEFKGIAVGDFWVLRPIDTDSKFIYSLIQSSKYQTVANLSTGTKMPRSDWGVVSNTEFEVPFSVEEQAKIGNFFKQLDDTIAFHQRKLEKMKALKSAYLSEMIPVEGEREPKRRFAGFTDAWKQRKLGEISDSFEYGLNASATFFDGINKYIRITDIDDDSRLFNQNVLTSPDVDLSNADSYLVKNGDILFARTGASVGKTYRYQESDGKVYYAGFLIRARINQDFNSEFVFQNTLTPRYDNFIKITSQRSGQPGVNAQEYASFDLMVPTLEEQQKIGTFFKALDDTITLHQRKLEKLQNIKKAYLHEMFV
ncbi:restriction endonuclease subunit S [Paenibacillus thiaminolyticus]|uniref:restriction endonuclease subunit S n=1 Tax=Paenibacillus thiaminolyticus TaxID=49283 RepID=UPI0035A5EACC